MNDDLRDAQVARHGEKIINDTTKLQNENTGGTLVYSSHNISK
jgi:hypothetical protein